jgi:hypothetical protein
VKLPWKSGAGQTDAVAGDAPSADKTPDLPRGRTPGKGRATPSRRQAEGRKRGPVVPAPQTRAEARARKKELRNSMTKEEKKAAADERRTAAADRREKMMQGDERFLAPRDQGKEKAYVRDLVDSRRHFSTLFIPLAVMIMVFMFLTASRPNLSILSTPALLCLMALMAIEGYITGRRINRAVALRFPNSTDTGFRLGWYAFMRSTQLRKMRAPRPRVSPGDAV